MQRRPDEPTGPLPLDADDVARAARVLAGVAHRTPVLTSRHLDEELGASVFCKAEHLQRVGAFKFRGGYHAVHTLPAAQRERGVVAYSSGNHAQAIALAAALHEIPAVIVMPTDAPAVKLAATRGYGAEVVLYDRYQDEDRATIGARIAAERGATVIPPFDHPAVMAGQGTVGRELAEQVDGLDLVVVPVGGGGLLSGCAVALAAAVAGIEVVGVEPAARHAARGALARGSVVEVPVPRTVLDGQQTTAIGERPLTVFRAHVDRVVGVEDEEVLATVGWLATRTKQVVEPSGAAALAALRSGRLGDVRGRRIGVVLSGGNLTPALLQRALATTTA
ncbi:MAG: pyridoxal-phosphate dependent enzyme [Nitriliruptoraceae bacterium]